MKKARKRKKLDVLAKPPEWARAALASGFGKAIEHLTPLESESPRFSHDRLQVSLVPFYLGIAESLGQ